jgi:hypothetical protein
MRRFFGGRTRAEKYTDEHADLGGTDLSGCSENRHTWQNVELPSTTYTYEENGEITEVTKDVPYTQCVYCGKLTSTRAGRHVK